MDRRPITIVIFTGFYLLGLLFLLWGILLPDIIVDLNVTKADAGVLFTLFSLGSMAGAIAGGKYASRFDYLFLLSVLIVVNAVTLVFMSLVTHWYLMLVYAGIIGIVAATIITIGHTLIARLYEEKRFKMMGIMDFMFSFGALSASFYVTGLYLLSENWRLPLQVMAGIMFLLSAYTLACAVRSSKSVSGDVATEKKTLSFKVVLRQPVFLFMAVLTFGYGAIEFGNANWFVTYAQTGLGYTGEQARNLLACFTGGMVISRLVYTYFLRFVTVHHLIMVLATGTLLGTLSIKLFTDLYLLGLGNFILGFSLGALFPLVLSSAMNIDSDNGPVLSGVSIVANSMGVQIASFSTGVWANSATINVAFWVIPMAGLILWLSSIGFAYKMKAAR